MEKDGRSGRAACAIYSQLYYFLFFSCILLNVFAFFVQFWAFLLILHDFGNLLHIFCVQIFQTQNFACAIM